MDLKELFEYALKSVPDAMHVRVKLGDGEIEVMRESVEPSTRVTHYVPSTSSSRPETAKAGRELVTAPLVGVFYEAPEPGAEPFARVGQKVKKGDTLCIIEAMKLFNEIESTCDGTVEEILAENGAMVEFGQSLFTIKSEV